MEDEEKKFWDDAYLRLSGKDKSLKQKYEDLEKELKEKFEEIPIPKGGIAGEVSLKSPKKEVEEQELKLNAEFEEISIPQPKGRPEDRPFQYVNLPLSGKLITSIDGTQLGEGDFQTLKNMRYGERGPKTVIGMTKINTSIFYSG